MKRTFLRVWQSPSVIEPMFLIRTKNGQTFILSLFNYLPLEEEVESVEIVNVTAETGPEEDYEEE